MIDNAIEPVTWQGYSKKETELICVRLRTWGKLMFEHNDNLNFKAMPFTMEWIGEEGERNTLTVNTYAAANDICLTLEGAGLFQDKRDSLIHRLQRKDYPITKITRPHNQGLPWGRYSVSLRWE